MSPRPGRPGEAGQAAVEMALALPLFLFLVFAVAETALMYSAKHLVMLSAFRAARSLLSTGSPEDAKESALTTVTPLEPKTQSRDITCVMTLDLPETSSAQVVYLYKPFFPLRPLAKTLGQLLFTDKKTGLVEKALHADPTGRWNGLLATRVPVTASVELLR